MTATPTNVYFRPLLKWCRLFHWRASLSIDRSINQWSTIPAGCRRYRWHTASVFRQHYVTPWMSSPTHYHHLDPESETLTPVYTTAHYPPECHLVRSNNSNACYLKPLQSHTFSDCHKNESTKHSAPYWSNQPFLIFWHSGILALSTERQSARMSKKQ